MSKKTEALKLLNQLKGISYIASILQELDIDENSPSATSSMEYQKGRRLLKLMYKNAQRGYGILIKEKHLPVTKMRKAVIFKLDKNIKYQIYDSMKDELGMNNTASFMYSFPNPE